MTDNRTEFEKWANAPPREKSLERCSNGSSWPGQYVSYVTELAWQAWMESRKQSLLEAAEIARAAEEKEAIELGFGAPIIAGSEAILKRSKEL